MEITEPSPQPDDGSGAGRSVAFKRLTARINKPLLAVLATFAVIIALFASMFWSMDDSCKAPETVSADFAVDHRYYNWCMTNLGDDSTNCSCDS